MEIPAVVLQHLKDVVTEAFPEEIVDNITVSSVAVDEEAGTISIELHVSTSVDPHRFAEGYFGLTGRVRKSLSDDGAKWGRFFPIITPSIGEKVHA